MFRPDAGFVTLTEVGDFKTGSERHVTSDLIVFLSAESTLEAYDLNHKTPENAWRTALSEGEALYLRGNSQHVAVQLSSESHSEMVALTELSTGRLKWTRPGHLWAVTEDGVLASPPRSSELVLIDVSGEIRWTSSAVSGTPWHTSLGIAVTTESTGWLLDEKTGDVLWESPKLGGNIFGVYAAGSILIVDRRSRTSQQPWQFWRSSGSLLGLRSLDGNKAWQSGFQPGAHERSVCLSGHRIITQESAWLRGERIKSRCATTGETLWERSNEEGGALLGCSTDSVFLLVAAGVIRLDARSGERHQLSKSN